MRAIFEVILCLHLLLPMAASAQDALKVPLSYSLKDYGFILAISLLGGVVSWYAKVRRGEAKGWQVSGFIGEMATSAFAGLIAFWLCEWANFPQLLTAALVGISGHMGTSAIQHFERFAEKKLGTPDKE